MCHKCHILLAFLTMVSRASLIQKDQSQSAITNTKINSQNKYSSTLSRIVQIITIADLNNWKKFMILKRIRANIKQTHFFKRHIKCKHHYFHHFTFMYCTLNSTRSFYYYCPFLPIMYIELILRRNVYDN